MCAATLLYRLQKADGDAMENGELVELTKLQASALSKEADFETRKRARLVEDFQSDKGEDSSEGMVHSSVRRTMRDAGPSSCPRPV